MKGSVQIQIGVLLVAVLATSAFGADCFSYIDTKKSAAISILPALMFYRQTAWLDLDATKSCTFSTQGDVMLMPYSTDLSV